NGELIGAFLPGRPAHTFLFSQRKYRDFELKFQVWLKGGDKAGNSGVQIRSVVTDERRCVVMGPQCEIGNHPTGTTCGSLLTEPMGKPWVLAPRALVNQVVKGEVSLKHPLRGLFGLVFVESALTPPVHLIASLPHAVVGLLPHPASKQNPKVQDGLRP